MLVTLFPLRDQLNMIIQHRYTMWPHTFCLLTYLFILSAIILSAACRSSAMFVLRCCASVTLLGQASETSLLLKLPRYQSAWVNCCSPNGSSVTSSIPQWPTSRPDPDVTSTKERQRSDVQSASTPSVNSVNKHLRECADTLPCNPLLFTTETQVSNVLS